MENNVEIIASREQSTMVSTWTEYLCLSPTKGGNFRLFTAQYEPLAEREAYFNEDTSDFELPQEIGGKPVVGIEDDWVVGGVLEPFDHELVMEFSSLEDDKVSGWLDANEWAILVPLEDLKSKLIRNVPIILSAPELPKRFWKIRDAAVEYVLSNTPLPADLGDLQDWLATDGWEDLLAAWINEDVAFNLKDWAVDKFSDSSLRDNEVLGATDEITDQMRIDFARFVIRNAVEKCEGYDSPSVHSFPIERKDGKQAILGCTVEIHGQAGSIPRWHGIFADKGAYYGYLQKTGFLLHSNADEISDAEILSLWVIETKNKKTSK